MKGFTLCCSNCLEPHTTLEHGKHVEINVTSTQFGAKCLVSMNCTVCGTVQDISEQVNQVGFQHFKEILEKQPIKKPKKEVTDPCPECGNQLRGKGIHEGGGIECSNPDCDYWFCY